MHIKVDYTNRRLSPGTGRPKHIFLDERDMEQSQEWSKEQREREERLLADYNRRVRTKRTI